MNYGYDLTTPGFKVDRAERLGAELERVLRRLPTDARGMRPYVEVGDDHPERETLYGGVRVRRITHYDEETIRMIVDQCDATYAWVMEVPL